MTYEVQPLPFKLSDLLLISHYENNYGGAVRRLSAIERRLEQEDWATLAVSDLNGLGRERLIATNSMILHEAYFEAIGGTGEPEGNVPQALERDFGSVDRWRAEFSAMGKGLAGGSGWVLLIRSDRLGRLTNQWAADHCHTVADSAVVLALDMDEHAYAIDFGAKAAVYVDTFLQMLQALNLDVASLPIIWDADFLYGPRTETGGDTYVLCEINVSSVFAIPDQAPAAIARLALERLRLTADGIVNLMDSGRRSNSLAKRRRFL